MKDCSVLQTLGRMLDVLCFLVKPILHLAMHCISVRMLKM